MLHVAFFQQRDGSLESDELLHAGHVNAVIVWIAHLGRRRYDDDLFRLQTVQNTDDTLFQGRTSDDAVVNDDKIVLTRNKAAIRDVIYMGCQVISRVAFSDERTQLDVFYGYFFTSDAL